MDAQLHLITTDEQTEWRLDRQTVEVGRRGIAMARAALREARQHRAGSDDGAQHASAA